MIAVVMALVVAIRNSKVGTYPDAHAWDSRFAAQGQGQRVRPGCVCEPGWIGQDCNTRK